MVQHIEISQNAWKSEVSERELRTSNKFMNAHKRTKPNVFVSLILVFFLCFAFAEYTRPNPNIQYIYHTLVKL